MSTFALHASCAYNRQQAQTNNLIEPKLESWGIKPIGERDTFNPFGSEALWFVHAGEAVINLNIESQRMSTEAIQWLRELVDEMDRAAIRPFEATIETDQGQYRMTLGPDSGNLDGPLEAAGRRLWDCFVADIEGIADIEDHHGICEQGLNRINTALTLAKPQTQRRVSALINALESERDHLSDNVQARLDALVNELVQADDAPMRVDDTPARTVVHARLSAIRGRLENAVVTLAPVDDDTPIAEVSANELGWLFLEGLFRACDAVVEDVTTVTFALTPQQLVVIDALPVLETILCHSDLEARPDPECQRRLNNFNRPLGEGLAEMSYWLAPSLRPTPRELAGEWYQLIKNRHANDPDSVENRFDATSGVTPC